MLIEQPSWSQSWLLFGLSKGIFGKATWKMMRMTLIKHQQYTNQLTYEDLGKVGNTEHIQREETQKPLLNYKEWESIPVKEIKRHLDKWKMKLPLEMSLKLR